VVAAGMFAVTGCTELGQSGLPGAFGTAGDAGMFDDGDDDDEDDSGTEGEDSGEGEGEGDGEDGADDDDDDDDDDDAVDDAGESGCVPEDEICDGLDNDCNDEVDETDPMLDAACDTGDPGICADGVYACTDGALVCVPSNTPTDETCNGEDDDCDGTVDNGDPGGGEDCDTALDGVCAAGVTQCGSGGEVECVQLVAEDDETCNGLDDDCNGTVDDNIPGVGNVCGTGLLGACAAGTFQCDGSAITCVPDVMPAPAEICGNMIDDDCNGAIDDTCGCPHDECLTGEPLTPACSTCAANVCAADPFCCATAWDAICVEETDYFCTDSCSCAHGMCFTGVALNPFCNTCVDTVCLFDSFCCATTWDDICISEVALYCGVTC